MGLRDASSAMFWNPQDQARLRSTLVLLLVSTPRRGVTGVQERGGAVRAAAKVRKMMGWRAVEADQGLSRCEGQGVEEVRGRCRGARGEL